MNEQDGLIHALLRGPDGEWRPADWDQVRGWTAWTGLLWVHLDRTGSAARRYLEQEAGVAPLVAEALLAEETRPRALAIDGNLLVNLRGVNLNPGADPEDMVSVRIWIEPDRVITCRFRRIMAIQDMREDIEGGRGPASVGDLLGTLSARLVARAAPVIEDIDDALDALEDEVLTAERADIRAKLSQLRRQAIALRRYLAPQREAMTRVQAEAPDWLDARQRARIRETGDRLTRYVEDLDAMRERAAVIQDELMNRISERINRNTYLLSLVAAVLLPLGFITGLLGINVDGMPGAKDAPWAFAAVCVAMFAIVLIEIYILRRLKWF